MTNFFEHQSAARRRTIWLIVYFVLAVVSIVALTYLLVVVVFAFNIAKADEAATWWNPGVLALVIPAVLLLVGGCTVYKVSELASGGHSVALLLGGKVILSGSRDLRERRLLNVVEEMAIASGVPVPPVYVMEDEDGINAFAAGYSPDSAVVGVSRGALEYLNRDELQGVVAHEFSHILNGDMRLNIRLIAIVFGIMGLAMIGSVLMRSSSRGSSRSKGRGQIVLLGLGLYLIGITGAFFGNLIKAAVSRQREFLADASAVQFTRNPEGIGGALKKIGGLESGGNLASVNAAEVSHMFFADALLARRLTAMFATHPPLGQRIRRIEPNWDGEYPRVTRVSVDHAEIDEPRRARVPALPGMPHLPLPVLAAGAEEVVSRVGTLTPDQMAYASEFLGALPESLQEAAREPFSARALIYALLLDPTPAVRDQQLARLQAGADPRDVAETRRVTALLADLPDAARLPLLDLAVSALRRMSPGQYQTFRRQIEHLIAADLNVNVFEYMLGCVLERSLDRSFGRVPPLPVKEPAGGIAAEVAAVLSLLAWEGTDNESAARNAFDAGMQHYLRGPQAHAILPRAECGLDTLDRRLRVLASTSMGARRRVLLACVACIAADRTATVREAELYRAIGSVLGCPIPPL